jgi:quinolinate synthase
MAETAKILTPDKTVLTDDTYQRSSLQVALVDGRPVVRAAELTRRAGAA